MRALCFDGRLPMLGGLAFACLLAACTSHRSVSPLGMPVLQGGSGGVAMPRIPDVNLQPRLPDRTVPLDWLELDVFFPPGARRVGPHGDHAFQLVADNRLRFPSAEPYYSPDKEFVLYYDGIKYSRKQITHWLMMRKKGADFSSAIFSTSVAYDVSWSPVSTFFAVTHYLGRNSSEVFVCGTSLFKEAIDVRPLVSQFFPAHFVEGSIFVKVYRWTDDGTLIVRAIGRSGVEPYELFGIELAASLLLKEREVRPQFLRGFIRE